MQIGVRLAKAKDIFLDESLFRKIYVITLMFEMIAFLDVFALGIRCAVLAWGGFILINKIVNKDIAKIKYNKLLIYFLIFGIITSFWNLSTHLAENLIFIYHFSVCFFIFYGLYVKRDYDKIEKEMIFIFRLFAILPTLFSVISLLLIFFRAQINIGSYYLGIFRSRLIGIYTNPNLLAFSVVVSIISCDILRDKYIKNKYKDKSFPTWLSVLFSGINFFSLFLSDSNASFVFIIVYFTTKIFYKSLSVYSTIKFSNLIREGSFLLACCVVMIAGSFLIRGACQDMISLLVYDIHKMEESVTDDNPDMPPNQSAVNTYMPDVSIGRENYDVSSGRVTLFRQGIKLFSVNPILGIGRGNMVLYGEKYIDGGLIFSDLHNSYLTILVSYGVVGFTIFLIFGVLVARDVCGYLFEGVYARNSGVYSKLFSVLVAYCAYSVFEKAILSEITFMVVFFWLVLGYILFCKEYAQSLY